MQAKTFLGKVAVVTGAAGGIGSAVAALFDREGISLVLTDIDATGLEKTAGHLRQAPLLVTCDITQPRQVTDLMQRAITHFGRIDILVNSAGIIRPAYFDEATGADIEAQVQVNLMGPLYCTHAAIAHLKESKGGNIITIASLAGVAPETKSAVYTATKYALRGLNLTLGVELKRHNIRVSTIFPDAVDTPMLAYEATHGGSPLTFLSPPVDAGQIARAVLRALTDGQMELYVPGSGALVARLLGLCPGIIPHLWPLLERLGERKRPAPA